MQCFSNILLSTVLALYGLDAVSCQFQGYLILCTMEGPCCARRKEGTPYPSGASDASNFLAQSSDEGDPSSGYAKGLTPDLSEVLSKVASFFEFVSLLSRWSFPQSASDSFFFFLLYGYPDLV